MRHFFMLFMMFIGIGGSLLAQETPELSLRRGHSGETQVIATALSKDLRLAYTVATEGDVKVWDAQAGRVLRTIYDQQAYPDDDKHGEIISGAFSPGVEWVATLDGQGVVRRFSLPDGKLAGSFGIENPRSVFLLTDGRSFYLVRDGRIEKRSLEGELQSQLELTDSHELHRQLISLASDGSLIAVAGEQGINIYKVADFSQVGTRATDARPRAVAFSPSSQELAYLTTDSIVLITTESPTERGRISLQESSSSSLLWSGDNPVIYNYDADGAFAVADFKDSTLTIFSQDASALTASFTPDSRIFFGGYGGQSWLQDPDTSTSRILPSDVGGFSSFDIDPRTGDLFTGSRGGELVRWSGQDGRVRQKYSGLKAWVSSVKVSPDGKKLLAADYYFGSVVCWNIETAETISSVKLRSGGFGEGVYTLAWLDPDHYVFTAAFHPLTVIEADTGREKLSWNIIENKNRSRPRCTDTRDGRIVAGYTNNLVMESSSLSKRDAITKEFPYGRHNHIVDVTYGATAETVYAVDNRGHVFEWNVSAPESQVREVCEINGNLIALEFREGLLQAWMRDGTIVTVSPDGETVSRVQLADSNVWGDHLVEDGVIVAIADYYKLGFYDLKTGLRKGRLVGVKGNAGWVALEDSGSFDGNDIGLSTIQFTLEGEVYGVDQFMTQYLRPGILAELLPGSKKQLRTAAPLTSSSVVKPPTVRVVKPESGAKISGEKVQILVEVIARGSGATTPLIYHNGHKLPDTGLRIVDDTHYQYEVELVQGHNEIEATAFDSSNQVESRRDYIRFNAPDVRDRPPKLHLLAVGIDSYSSGLKLEFAGADAQSISELFQSDLYSTGTRTLLKNNEATQEGIKKAITHLASVAEPQDAFVLYLAGHGTVVNDTYYFLPQDVQTSSDQELEKTALSADLLGNMLASVPATKQLLVLDTCRAGKLVEDGKIYSRPGLEEVRSHNILSRTSGTFLIAATKEKDYAFEVPQLGHGILTYSVLETLGVKGSEGEAAVTANELLRAVSEKVPELSQKYNGTRQSVVQYSSGQDFPLTK